MDDKGAASPWAEQVRQLHRTLELPVTALVEILQVTRPAFYDWLRGQTPNRSNQERLRMVSKIAEAWTALGVGPMSRYWNVPMPSAGAELRAVMMSPDLSLDKFNALITRMGIGKRLLPPRASKPLLVARDVRDRQRSRQRTWSTTSPDAD